MDKSYVKVGTYIRWTADRTFRGWDTFGVITKVTAKEVTIQTFDDMKETTIGIEGEAMKEEIRWASKDEIEHYIETRVIEMEFQIKKLELECKNKIKEINKSIDAFKNLVK